MKSNKILKILGVVVTLATLTSMFLFASPVSAAFTPQAWNEIPLPSTTGNVLAGFDDLGPIAQAKDASAIYMGASNGGYDPAPFPGEYTTSATNGGLYKSTDFGRTWTLVAAFPNDLNYTGQIFDITCSSQDASTVYVTDGRNIYKTVNAGTSWTTIAGLFSNVKIYPDLSYTTGLWITSLSVGYVSGSPEIFASVSGFDGAHIGGAYVCNENVYGSPWSDLNIGSDRPVTSGVGVTTALDVARITVLPDFATSQGVMAVWTDYSNDMTRVSTKYGGNQWDTTANGVDVEYTDGTSLETFDAPLLDASIFIPSDFSSNPNTGLMQAYIGINSVDLTSTLGEGPNDVYLAYFGPATSMLSPAFDLNIGGTDTSTNISGMSGSGTAAAADIMVSGFDPAFYTVPVVYTTKNGSAGPWVKASKAPTGSASPLYPVALSSVLLKTDFATSGQAIVATQGDNATVSFTQDFGVTFNSISMIDTTIDSLTTMALTSDNTIYAITADSSPTASIIWRYTAATSSWELVDNSALVAGNPTFENIVALSDNSAVFVADSNGVIYRSTNKGQTWVKQLTLNPGGAVSSLVAVNANTILVGSTGGAIFATNTNGVVWFTRAAFAGGTVTDIRVASNGDYLAADINGNVASVAKSTDGGLTWTAFLSTLTTNGASAIYITPATNYATSGNVYLTSADSTANRGVYFATATTTTGWTRADSEWNTFPSGVDTFELRSGTGIVATAGGPGSSTEGTGMIYATDSYANTGLLRIKGSATVAEGVSAPVTNIYGLWLGANSVGSVSLYTIGSDNNIYTYIDTLNKAGSGVTVSPITITTSSATVSWTALPNATAYWVVLTPSYETAITSVYDTPAADAVAGVVFTNSATVTGLDSTTTYAVSVWAVGVGNPTTDAFESISSFMFSGTFSTNPAVPEYPESELVPNAGAQNVALLVNFQWDAVPGATSYELKIDTNLDLSTAKDYTGIAAPAGNSAGDFSLPSTDALAYNTLYYWEVRAVTATGHSNWSGIWSFTTVSAPQAVVTVPPAPTPTIIITAPAQVTITQAASVPTPIYTLPEPNITIQQASTSTPTYIWIIVGVGALLTLAVIILIIRTRRVV
jgi:hypothetical protein